MTTRQRLVVTLMAASLAACSPAPSSPPTSDHPSPIAGASESPSVVAASATPPASVDPSQPVAADLDGMLVGASDAHRLPLAVSIDDARPGRPQSGFNATSVVWQTPVDGYETRYLFEFQELDAPDVGPVRSARLFLAHWAAELDAGLAHYGGDRLTRAWMTANRGTLFTDLDGLGAGNPAYHRTSRPAPYNAYTSTAELRRVADKLGAGATISPGVHLRPFRDDVPADQRPAAQAFSIPYNTVRIGYAYDSRANAYRRLVNGVAQVDAMDGQPVWARTVVVLAMPFHTDSTIEPGHDRPVLGFVGSGVAEIFMEGRLVTGQWTKATESAPTVILGPDGTELPLIRGRIFMQVVPLGTKVTGG